MQKILPATVLVLGAGFALLGFYNPQSAPPGTNASQSSSPNAQQTSSQSPNTRGSGDATQTQVDFQDSQPFTMISAGDSKYHTTVYVRNDESIESSLEFSIVLEDADGKELSGGSAVTAKPSKISANTVSRVWIELSTSGFRPPLSGFLKLTSNSAPGRKASIKYRVVKVPPTTPSSWATGLFWLSFAGTALVALGALILLRKKNQISVTQRMGSPTWNFGDSWGTNIAVGGALLNTLVTFSALPEQTQYLSKVSYVCVSMIFGAVITVAPAIYSLIRTAVAMPAGSTPAIQYQGYVGWFAVASALTAWGAIGQIVTVALLFAELGQARLISISILACLAAVLGVAAVLLFAYEGRTIVQIARLQKAASTAGGGAAQGLPSWSVL